METLESLDRKINSARDLLSVVKTMKSLAAVNIRTYERAVGSLADYESVIHLAWQALFPLRARLLRESSKKDCVLLVVGADQGMCGQFNETLAEEVVKVHSRLRERGLRVRVWTTGERLRSAMQEFKLESDAHYPLPGSLPGITSQVQALLGTYASSRLELGGGHFWLGHNQARGQSSYEPRVEQVLPLTDSWFERMEGERWPGRGVPLIGSPMDQFFRHLFQQYMFISLFRGLAGSMAAENAARLAAMQAAEKNIRELQDELLGRFNDTRQRVITEELLDVIAGFEALDTG